MDAGCSGSGRERRGKLHPNNNEAGERRPLALLWGEQSAADSSNPHVDNDAFPRESTKMVCKSAVVQPLVPVPLRRAESPILEFRRNVVDSISVAALEAVSADAPACTTAQQVTRAGKSAEQLKIARTSCTRRHN